MKKFFAAALLCLTGVFAYSQSGIGVSLGARIGGGPNFYKSELGNINFSGYSVSVSMEGAFGLNAAAQMAVQFNDFFALQGELMYTADEAKLSALGVEAGTAKAHSLLIPVLVKAGTRQGNFSFAGLGGIYFSVPLGKMELALNGGYGVEWIQLESPLGFMVGGCAGMLLGPGSLFADLRYAGDLGKTKGKIYGATADLFTRSKFLITIGYEVFLVGGPAPAASGRSAPSRRR
jgi:hypothetical protein